MIIVFFINDFVLSFDNDYEYFHIHLIIEMKSIWKLPDKKLFKTALENYLHVVKYK